MDTRMIMIEVTEEEYEKIKNGALNIDKDELKEQTLRSLSTEDLIYELDNLRSQVTQRVIEDVTRAQRTLLREGTVIFKDGRKFEYTFSIPLSMNTFTIQ